MYQHSVIFPWGIIVGKHVKVYCNKQAWDPESYQQREFQLWGQGDVLSNLVLLLFPCLLCASQRLQPHWQSRGVGLDLQLCCAPLGVREAGTFPFASGLSGPSATYPLGNGRGARDWVSANKLDLKDCSWACRVIPNLTDPHRDGYREENVCPLPRETGQWIERWVSSADLLVTSFPHLLPKKSGGTPYFCMERGWNTRRVNHVPWWRNYVLCSKIVSCARQKKTFRQDQGKDGGTRTTDLQETFRGAGAITGRWGCRTSVTGKQCRNDSGTGRGKIPPAGSPPYLSIENREQARFKTISVIATLPQWCFLGVLKSNICLWSQSLGFADLCATLFPPLVL